MSQMPTERNVAKVPAGPNVYTVLLIVAILVLWVGIGFAANRLMSALPALLAVFGLVCLLLALTGRASTANVAVAACCVLFAAHAVVYGEWLIDDAAISYTYAKNLAEGHGLVLYPGAEPLEAYSNPLWVMLLSPGHLAGIPFVWLAKILGVTAGTGAILISYRIARRNLGISSGLALLVPLLIALNAVYVLWAVSGLENSVLALLIMAVVWAAESELRREKAPLVAPVLSVLHRTDGDHTGAPRPQARVRRAMVRFLRRALRALPRVALLVLRLACAEHVLREKRLECADGADPTPFHRHTLPLRRMG